MIGEEIRVGKTVGKINISVSKMNVDGSIKDANGIVTLTENADQEYIQALLESYGYMVNRCLPA